MNATDVVVIGGGHNGLVCATLLARAGLQVTVAERAAVLGGATRTEAPFAKAPQLRHSTGAYLVGLVPPELLAKLRIELPLLRRDPHYFLPTLGSASLLLGSDRGQVRDQLLRFFSEQDWKAMQALDAEISALRDDIAPTWLAEPLSIEETAERWVRPPLKRAFVDLCRKPICDYLPRFGFQSDLLMAMYATTDAFSGLDGTWDTPGTGMNFLVHNMCRLPNADGTWMILEGGLGTFVQRLRVALQQAGGRVLTSSRVSHITTTAGVATGVRLEGGEEIAARAVVCAADPFTMLSLVGDGFDDEYRHGVEAKRRPGTTLKLNMALSGLPTFRCHPENHGQHAATMHLLAQGDYLRPGSSTLDHLVESYRAAKRGELPDFPTIEWYVHTTVDPSLASGSGLHSSALFVQWAPHRPAAGTWAENEEPMIERLLAVCDAFAPGTSDLVVDRQLLHPQKIEEHFGIANGHIHHVDNSYGFDERVGYRTALPGLYFGSAGAHPAGSVIGAAGHNAAQAVLSDLAVPTSG